MEQQIYKTIDRLTAKKETFFCFVNASGSKMLLKSETLPDNFKGNADDWKRFPQGDFVQNVVE